MAVDVAGLGVAALAAAGVVAAVATAGGAGALARVVDPAPAQPIATSKMGSDDSRAARANEGRLRGGRAAARSVSGVSMAAYSARSVLAGSTLTARQAGTAQ